MLLQPLFQSFTACPMGTYKPTAGNESCSPCPDNSMATIEGSTICECEANYVRPTSNAAGEACSGNVTRPDLR